MKKNILTKIVKRDYNNRLEEVLSKKDFSEEVKNSLLTMFYKIENGYDDYIKIKRETFDKKEYIEKLIDIIEKDCDKIQFVKNTNSDEESVDKEKKEIICLPIEHKILYSLAKIRKRNVVVKYIDENIAQAFSYALNTGNNINIVEPLRDFNGFSWNIIVKEIEELNYNLMYQNIIYLMGNKFIDKWVNNYEPLVDYFDLFKVDIEKKYSKKIEAEITQNLLILSIKLREVYDEDFNKEIRNIAQNLKDELSKMEDRKQYLLDISKEKKEKEKEIKLIDKIVNDKNLIMEEYQQRNKELPLERKIFSIRVFKKNLEQERIEILKQIDDCNKIMNPKFFLEKKHSIEEKIKYLDNQESIKDILINLQKEVIKCMYIDIREAKEKNELIELIYKYRYYNLLPINDEQCIFEIKELQSSLNKLTKVLINKAIELKTIIQISNNEKQNYDITQKLLLSKIINLQDINIKVSMENEQMFLTVFDEEIEDEKMELKGVKKEDIKIKLNKKNKLFI